MTSYNISGRVVNEESAEFARAVANAYGRLPRPLCLCRQPGIEMYIAHVGHQYIIKRMPDTGQLHSPSCASYAAPAVLSGLAPMLGTAIQTDAVDGITTLKLNFPMTRRASAHRAGTEQTGEHAESVRGVGARLTLRGILHYLWTEAGFHRWSPAMAGKRNWHVVRKYLLRATEDKLIKAVTLSSMVFVPEAFEFEYKEAIEQRRRERFARFATDDRQRALMLVVGEVKGIQAARYGSKLILKHLPDVAFNLTADVARLLELRFAETLECWNTVDEMHLVFCGTCSVSRQGIPSVEELTLMLTTAQWLPVENLQEKTLVDTLVLEKRRFDKIMRFNVPQEVPMASAILTDTGVPVAIFVVPPTADQLYSDELAIIRDSSGLPAWTWPSGAEELLSLPPAMKRNEGNLYA